MPIILREQKGTPLTAAEVDGNFKEISRRLEQLESFQPIQEKLTNIEQEGNTLIFRSNLGTEWGRAKLPILNMNFRGLWDKNQQYYLNDIISYQDELYLCADKHTSHSFDIDHSYWLKLFNIVSQDKSYPKSYNDNKSNLPLMTKDKMSSPIFGSLAIFVGDQSLELLLGDIDCWRKVKDMQPFKI